jgi:hypothetical protein
MYTAFLYFSYSTRAGKNLYNDLTNQSHQIGIKLVQHKKLTRGLVPQSAWTSIPLHYLEIVPCAHYLEVTSTTYYQPISRLIDQREALTGTTINATMAPDGVPTLRESTKARAKEDGRVEGLIPHLDTTWKRNLI